MTFDPTPPHPSYRSLRLLFTFCVDNAIVLIGVDGVTNPGKSNQFHPYFRNDPDRGSDQESAFWQLLVVLVLGRVRSEFVDEW